MRCDQQGVYSENTMQKAAGVVFNKNQWVVTVKWNACCETGAHQSAGQRGLWIQRPRQAADTLEKLWCVWHVGWYFSRKTSETLPLCCYLVLTADWVWMKVSELVSSAAAAVLNCRERKTNCDAGRNWDLKLVFDILQFLIFWCSKYSTCPEGSVRIKAFGNCISEGSSAVHGSVIRCMWWCV